MITQKDLKKKVKYNPETGIFTWRNNTRQTKAGEPAGHENGRGYLRICFDGKRYMAARLVFLYVDGFMPETDVDHINGKRTDNRYKNLRIVTRKENARNTRINPRNTTGCMGVSLNKQYGKFHAYITARGKRLTIGYYDQLEDAIRARKQAEAKYGYHMNHGRAA